MPDRYVFKHNPSGMRGVDINSLRLTPDGILFVFNQIVVDAPQYIGMEASLLVASHRCGQLLDAKAQPDEINKNRQTVVEAMIQLDDETASEKGGNSPIPDLSSETFAFDYVIKQLNVLLRAISFVQKCPIKMVSRESLPPMIGMAFSKAKPEEFIIGSGLPELQGMSLFMVNRNFELPPDSPGISQSLDTWIDSALVNQSSRAAFSTFLDFRREAEINRSKEGNYRTATIMYAAACESLLEDLLQHNLWEQQIRPEIAVERFVTRKGYPRPITHLVFEELGDFYSEAGWKKDSPEPINAWQENVAQLRNRAVHEGYEPTAEELSVCVDSINQLVTFLADQAYETRHDRPVTALALLGQQGFEARGGWSEALSTLESDLIDINERIRRFRRWSDALLNFRSRNRPEIPDAQEATCYLVANPSGEGVFYLVEKGGVRTQKIHRGQIVLSDEAQESLEALEGMSWPEIPIVYSLDFVSVSLQTQPDWNLFSYDVLPGHGIF